MGLASWPQDNSRKPHDAASAKKTLPKRTVKHYSNSIKFNVQRNRAATLRVDFRFRRIRRSGSRICSAFALLDYIAHGKPHDTWIH